MDGANADHAGAFIGPAGECHGNEHQIHVLRDGGVAMMSDVNLFEPIPPILELLSCLTINVGAPVSIDDTPLGNRKMIPIIGGSFTGEKLSGTIRAGGADSLLIRADGCAEVDARYTLETEDGALIYAQDRGLRHGPKAVMARLAQGESVNPADYYFRTSMTLTTGHANYQWLNQLLIVGSGCRAADKVLVNLYAVR